MKEIPAAFKTTLTYLDKVNSDGEPKTIKLEDLYEFDSKIGKGANGIVCLCICRKSQK